MNPIDLNAKPKVCNKRREGDTIVCHRCGKSWSLNEDTECLTNKEYGNKVLEELRMKLPQTGAVKYDR